MYDAIKVIYSSDPVASGLAEKIETLAPAKASAPSGITTTSTNTMVSEESGAETPTNDGDAKSYSSGKRLKKGQNKVDKLDLLMENVVKNMKLEERSASSRANRMS